MYTLSVQNPMTAIRFIFHALKLVIAIGVLFLALWAISSRFAVLGSYRSFLVQSGSMEPAIMTGDIIIVQDKGGYSINDVVTFQEDAGRIVTHRIVGVDHGTREKYTTKGDANRSEDQAIIASDRVIGKVILVLPKLGFAVAFAQSQNGLVVLLIVPAVILIIDELIKMKKNVGSGS